jgi:hypothetical protein
VPEEADFRLVELAFLGIKVDAVFSECPKNEVEMASVIFRRLGINQDVVQVYLDKGSQGGDCRSVRVCEGFLEK